MPDAIFARPRLARVYDAFDDGRGDLEAYLRIADELRARRVVDVGCGTGTFALLLASTGCQVTGVDPAGASLDIARAKPGAERITWLPGDATALPAGLDADLATMTGNVAQVFLTDDEWAATLRGVRRCLRAGGHLVFEARRPEREIWREWAADTGPVREDIPGAGVVERRREVTEVALPFVSFRYTYVFEADGAVETSTSTLRFRTEGELRDSLRAAGFTTTDVREAPDRPGLEMVFLAAAGAGG